MSNSAQAKPMWFDHMSDERMLLTLCIREEELDDPSAWCRDFRAHCHETREGPSTTAEAEAMMSRSDALVGRINKKPI